LQTPALTTWQRRHELLERKTRFELATSSLARRHSTTELLPHIFFIKVMLQRELGDTAKSFQGTLSTLLIRQQELL
jgi:hypothetical protein